MTETDALTDEQLAQELFARAFGPGTTRYHPNRQMPADWPSLIAAMRVTTEPRMEIERTIGSPAAWAVVKLILGDLPPNPKADLNIEAVRAECLRHAWFFENLIRELVLSERTPTATRP